MTEKACENCKHWEFDDDYCGVLIGRCHAAAFLFDSFDWNDEGKLQINPERKNTKVFLQDQSDYWATMHTAHDFWCASYEPPRNP